MHPDMMHFRIADTFTDALARLRPGTLETLDGASNS